MIRSDRRARPLALRCATVGIALTAALPLPAQQRLIGFRTATVGLVFETWSFGDGVYQPSLGGTDSVLVQRASQWSVPINVEVPLGRRWRVDLAGAYATGEVTLDQTVSGATSFSLSGFSDLKVRAVGRLVGDNVLVTLGVNLPTGQTSLDDDELSALRVLAAPALRLRTPAIGLGPGGTTGIVVARQIGGWAWALGLSYEYRGTYSAPAAVLAAGVPSELNPGDAFHLTLGTDGFLGQHGMTLGLSADFYTKDNLTPDSAGAAAARDTRLGPTLTAEWQLRIAVPRLRELSLYAVERYRSKFEQNGVTAPGSSGNYLDFGVRSVWPASPSLGIVVGLDGRHHTGLKVDDTLVTAAALSGGGTVGLQYERGGYALQPFVRAQVGRLDTGGTETTMTGIGLGMAGGVRF